MPKVVTGAGLQEFIETGKHEVMKADKPSAEAAPLEVKKETPAVDIKPEEKAPEKPEVKDEGLEPEDHDLSEAIRKKIGKKHRAMKEAQEAAQDAKTFAKNQYERARLAEERASALERELSEAKKATPKEPELKKPDIKDFTDNAGQIRWTDYTDKAAEYAAAKAVEGERARFAQEQEARTKAERLEKAKVKYPDFLDVLGATDAQVPNAVLQYITESEYGPDISYFLAKNKAEVDRISKLPPIRAIAEIGKLETTFEKPAKPAEAAAAPPVAERGGAPPPITPVSGTGSGTVNLDPAKMSFRELREYEKSKSKRR